MSRIVEHRGEGGRHNRKKVRDTVKKRRRAIRDKKRTQEREVE